MVQRICNYGAVLILGVAVGLVSMVLWGGGIGQPTLVQATATQGKDNFSIATGIIDNGLEGFYFLDFLTGDLRAAVISRRSGKFEGFFEYNVQNDFGATKNPKYLMVTGQVDLPRGSGPSQIASGVIYVAEATTGQVYAYVLPFSSSENNAGRRQTGTFQRLDGGAFRTTFVRDQ